MSNKKKDYNKVIKEIEQNTKCFEQLTQKNLENKYPISSYAYGNFSLNTVHIIYFLIGLSFLVLLIGLFAPIENKLASLANGSLFYVPASLIILCSLKKHNK